MRYVIAHGHIFKNAGTTFDWSLQKNFGNGFLDHREDQLMLENGCEHLAQVLSDDQALCAISSHHMTGQLPSLPDVQFLPVYLLRHPVARIRSVYEFERVQQVDTPGARAARSKTFRDYVAWRMQEDVRPVIRNYQTRYLAGQHGMVSQAEVAAHCFAEATESLRTACLVGVVECYDESMVVLEESLKPFYPQIDLSYIPQNVSASVRREDSEQSIVGSVLGELGDLQEQVIDANSFDLALYQMACVQLRTRVDSIYDFPAKLQGFRSRRP